ncbi:hypothetical protein HNP40_002608 [Mycobacteroides chelonae]|nr:hypothetical protein [Mycobacteroides chelonae]
MINTASAVQTWLVNVVDATGVWPLIGGVAVLVNAAAASSYAAARGASVP